MTKADILNNKHSVGVGNLAFHAAACKPPYRAVTKHRANIVNWVCMGSCQSSILSETKYACAIGCQGTSLPESFWNSGRPTTFLHRRIASPRPILKALEGCSQLHRGRDSCRAACLLTDEIPEAEWLADSNGHFSAWVLVRSRCLQGTGHIPRLPPLLMVPTGWRVWRAY